ncbi:MAG: hypothetical protein M0006_06905 [Magnetospirillum sp.]|nr:hypothetical protein [Magnetospirillum sp.]
MSDDAPITASAKRMASSSAATRPCPLALRALLRTGRASVLLAGSIAAAKRKRLVPAVAEAISSKNASSK